MIESSRRQVENRKYFRTINHAAVNLLKYLDIQLQPIPQLPKMPKEVQHAVLTQPPRVFYALASSRGFDSIRVEPMFGPFEIVIL